MPSHPSRIRTLFNKQKFPSVPPSTNQVSTDTFKRDFFEIGPLPKPSRSRQSRVQGVSQQLNCMIAKRNKIMVVKRNNVYEGIKGNRLLRRGKHRARSKHKKICFCSVLNSKVTLLLRCGKNNFIFFLGKNPPESTLFSLQKTSVASTSHWA